METIKTKAKERIDHLSDEGKVEVLMCPNYVDASD